MSKAYLDWHDISEMFHLSKGNAYALIRSVKAVSFPPGFGALGRGRILPSELERWREMFGRELTPDEKENVSSANAERRKCK